MIQGQDIFCCCCGCCCGCCLPQVATTLRSEYLLIFILKREKREREKKKTEKNGFKWKVIISREKESLYSFDFVRKASTTKKNQKKREREVGGNVSSTGIGFGYRELQHQRFGTFFPFDGGPSLHRGRFGTKGM
jgi:hypothetical protein